MKTIKKFWGVVFILALLSTLFIGAVPQAAADNYVWGTSRALPGSSAADMTLALYANTTTPAEGFGITAVAQSGATIVCATADNTTVGGNARFFKSTDGGITWTQITGAPALQPAAGANYTSIAIAPDNPGIIAVVGNEVGSGVGAAGRPQVVWVTKTGGATWSRLTALAAGAYINDIAISPVVGGIRRITVGGNSDSRSTANITAYSNLAYLVTYDLDAISPTWTAPTGWAALNVNNDNVMAVAYSPNYLADYALIVVTYELPPNDSLGSAASGGSADLHVYSYNTNLWDALVESSFPKVLESAVTTTNVSIFQKAQITLDANFFLGDQAAQIGFIGTMIQSTAANVTFTNIGGVYRFDVIGGPNTCAQIYTGAINSVAWDGTNLMAADLNTNAAMGPLLVRRSANALASPAGVSFVPNSIYKAPGTGYDCKVLFNATSGLGFAFSNGNGSCVAKTADYGKSFNGYKLINSHFGDLMDFWMNPSGSVIYALATDNVDMNLWKGTWSYPSWQWERVFILNHVGNLAIAGDPAYLVRADKDNPDNVYLGLQGAVGMFKSTDGGITWTPRSCSQNIRDFAVQDAITVYVAVNGNGNLVKTIAGGLSWSDPPTSVLPAGGGNCNILNLLSDNNILLAGTTGGVAYTTDGASWTYLAALPFGGAALVEATGLNTGDTIFAGNAAMMSTWVIGTTHVFIPNQIAGAGGSAGMVYANGILYTYDTGNNRLRRWLSPTSTNFGAGVAGPNDILYNSRAVGFTNAGKPLLNMLKAATGTSYNSGAAKTDLWVRNADDNKSWFGSAAPDDLFKYTEYLTAVADAPTPVYPTNNALISVNSISGFISPFNFTWDAPRSIIDTATEIGYNYNLAVYLDSAGTNLVAGGAVALALAANSTSTQLAFVNPGAFAPGTTYYWRVRVNAGTPMLSQWSAMESLVIQQLVAIVPVIASPVNGGEVTTVNPAFSWSPISLATSYRFELATDADFTDVLYTVDPATAGASVPSTITLTRGLQYFWHVKTLTPLDGEWSATANFIVAELPPTSPTPTTTIVPTPTIIITQPPAVTTTFTIPPAEPPKEVNPSYIWAIIIVGAVLVIAVIVLIVRTRRSV